MTPDAAAWAARDIVEKWWHKTCRWRRSDSAKVVPLVDAIAAALVEARREALEEAARVALDWPEVRHKLIDALPTYYCSEAVKIAAAIRLLAGVEEGRG